MSAPLFGPDWITKDPEWHAEKYGKFLAAVENASNSSDEGIKQVCHISILYCYIVAFFVCLVWFGRLCSVV
jgi:hypothetical protein